MQKHFSRISGYMNPYKIMLIHNKKLNHKIKRLNERYACVLCNESSLSIHYRNMQVLATQIFRVYNEISLKTFDGNSPIDSTYQL